MSADALDENLGMGESKSMQAIMEFALYFNDCFGDEYLRKPRKYDLLSMINAKAERGFPVMLGSIELCKWF